MFKLYELDQETLMDMLVEFTVEHTKLLSHGSSKEELNFVKELVIELTEEIESRRLSTPAESSTPAVQISGSN